MANRGETAFWGLIERARLLRRDAFKLSRQLGKTCDEIKARNLKSTQGAQGNLKPPAKDGRREKTSKNQ